jgi:hypothetical protein
VSTTNQPPPEPPMQIGVPPYRIRHPGKFRNKPFIWPLEYATRQEADKELRESGLTASEVIDSRGQVVTNSEAWWARQGKDGRP